MDGDKIPYVSVLRLGHRRDRDKRITSHLGLTARAFGADEIHLAGEEDPYALETWKSVTKRFGGKFKCFYEKKPLRFLRRFSKNSGDGKPGTIIHLTMYGENWKDELPKIDAILITHDHYDHLDLESIKKLHPKVDTFFVALGVKKHLCKWGIDADKVIELDWWQCRTFHNVQITFTPSRHFSGRGLRDREKSLWGGWVFKTKEHSIYWSGDGGYGPHFKEVGEKLDTILLPKAGTASDVYMIDCLLTQIETNKKLKNKIGIECLIETALGMSNIKEIAKSSERLEALHFGVADYAASLRARTVVIGGLNPDYPGDQWLPHCRLEIIISNHTTSNSTCTSGSIFFF